MKKVTNKNSTNIASINLKHIRNMAISSLVMEIVAVILGFLAFWLIKDVLVSTISANNLNVSQIFYAFNSSEHLASLILISAFMILTFIGFFVLPTISASCFGWKLESNHKGLLTSLILATPASLLFLPFVVLVWPIAIFVVISKSELGIKKELLKTASQVKTVVTPQQTRIVDLTTDTTEIKKAPQSVVYKLNQNKVIPKPQVNTIYSTTARPQTTTIYSTVSRPQTTATVSRPQSTNTVYVRNTRPTTV